MTQQEMLNKTITFADDLTKFNDKKESLFVIDSSIFNGLLFFLSIISAYFILKMVYSTLKKTHIIEESILKEKTIEELEKEDNFLLENEKSNQRKIILKKEEFLVTKEFLFNKEIRMYICHSKIQNKIILEFISKKVILNFNIQKIDLYEPTKIELNKIDSNLDEFLMFVTPILKEIYIKITTKIEIDENKMNFLKYKNYYVFEYQENYIFYYENNLYIGFIDTKEKKLKFRN